MRKIIYSVIACTSVYASLANADCLNEQATAANLPGYGVSLGSGRVTNLTVEDINNIFNGLKNNCGIVNNAFQYCQNRPGFQDPNSVGWMNRVTAGPGFQFVDDNAQKQAGCYVGAFFTTNGNAEPPAGYLLTIGGK